MKHFLIFLCKTSTVFNITAVFFLLLIVQTKETGFSNLYVMNCNCFFNSYIQLSKETNFIFYYLIVKSRNDDKVFNFIQLSSSTNSLICFPLFSLALHFIEFLCKFGVTILKPFSLSSINLRNNLTITHSFKVKYIKKN